MHFAKILCCDKGETNVAVVTELEEVYKCVEERENDFKVAAEIGQMLVQRNQQLMQEKDDTRKDYEAKVL